MQNINHPSILIFLSRTLLKWLLTLAFCLPSISLAKAISVGADPWCPYTCHPEKDKKEGYLVDILKMALTPIKVDYAVFNWARVLEQTRSGKMTAALGAGEQDKQGLMFNSEPLGKSKNCFYVGSASSWQYSGISSLASMKLGVITAYTYEPELDHHIEKMAKDNYYVQAAPTENALNINLKKLLSNRLDVLIEDEFVMMYSLKQNTLGEKIKKAGCLKETPIYIGFSEKDPMSKQYKKMLDDKIKEIKKSGELKKILTQYGLENLDL